MGVGRGLISMIWALFWRAIIGREAAGSTKEEVPIEKKTSQFSAAATDAVNAPVGRVSPNQTTSGRRYALQLGQRGGISFVQGS